MLTNRYISNAWQTNYVFLILTLMHSKFGYIGRSELYTIGETTCQECYLKVRSSHEKWSIGTKEKSADELFAHMLPLSRTGCTCVGNLLFLWMVTCICRDSWWPFTRAFGCRFDAMFSFFGVVIVWFPLIHRLITATVTISTAKEEYIVRSSPCSIRVMVQSS